MNGVELVDGQQNFFPALPDVTGFNTYLGAGEGGSLYRLFGVLDDVRIYDGALSATDIASLFRADSTPVPEPLSLALFGLSLVGLGLARRLYINAW